MATAPCPSARAAIAGGASWLAVADARELRELREAGLAEVPVLVMGALGPASSPQALAAGGDVLVWSEHQVAAVAAAGGGRVHVKLDSGMGRLGTRDAQEAARRRCMPRTRPGGRARRPDDPLRHRRRARDDGFFARSWSASRLGARRQGASTPRSSCTPPTAPPRCAMREAQLDMVRCGDRDLRHGPVRRGSARRAASSRRSSSSSLRGRGQALRGRESAGYGRRSWRARRPTWGCCRSATATAGGAGSRTTPTC